MAQVILALGSNLGDREGFLDFAVAQLNALPSINVLQRSKTYETQPVDVPEPFQDLIFLNAAVLIETTLSPHILLEEIHKIEALAHRKRFVRNGPRTLDIDIIAYQGITLDTPDLILPHPRALQREFVTRPIADLSVNILDLTAGIPATL